MCAGGGGGGLSIACMYIYVDCALIRTLFKLVVL